MFIHTKSIKQKARRQHESHHVMTETDLSQFIPELADIDAGGSSETTSDPSAEYETLNQVAGSYVAETENLTSEQQTAFETQMSYMVDQLDLEEDAIASLSDELLASVFVLTVAAQKIGEATEGAENKQAHNEARNAAFIDNKSDMNTARKVLKSEMAKIDGVSNSQAKEKAQAVFKKAKTGIRVVAPTMPASKPSPDSPTGANRLRDLADKIQVADPADGTAKMWGDTSPEHESKMTGTSAEDVAYQLSLIHI